MSASLNIQLTRLRNDYKRVAATGDLAKTSELLDALYRVEEKLAKAIAETENRLQYETIMANMSDSQLYAQGLKRK